jgi:hypothetical protein
MRETGPQVDRSLLDLGLEVQKTRQNLVDKRSRLDTERALLVPVGLRYSVFSGEEVVLQKISSVKLLLHVIAGWSSKGKEERQKTF